MSSIVVFPVDAKSRSRPSN